MPTMGEGMLRPPRLPRKSRSVAKLNTPPSLATMAGPSPRMPAEAREWLRCVIAEEERERERLGGDRAERNARRRAQRAEARGEIRSCEVCGSGYRPTRSDARYCPGACRVAAHRLRSRPRRAT